VWEMCFQTPSPAAFAKLSLRCGDLSPQERGEVFCACSCVKFPQGASAGLHRWQRLQEAQ